MTLSLVNDGNPISMLDWEDVLKVEFTDDRRPYGEMCSGITVHRQGRALLVMMPNDGFRSLSSGFTNGGYMESPQAVLNVSGIGGKVEYTTMEGGLATYDRMNHMYASKLGLDPGRVVHQGTAASMDNAAISNEVSDDGTEVSLAITAGISHNGGRSGDPASYDESQSGTEEKSGTIISIMAIDADLSDSAMLQAMLILTEAKSCVIQELQARSLYSHGIATGSGTDQVTIISNKGSRKKIQSIDRDSGLAVAIARCMNSGLREAFDRQAGMNPETQWDALHLMSRYTGRDEIREEMRFPARMEELLSALDALRKDPSIAAVTTVILNIADDVRNGLIPEKDGIELSVRMCEDMVIGHRTDPVERIRLDNMDSVADVLSYVSAIKLMDTVRERRSVHGE